MTFFFHQALSCLVLASAISSAPAVSSSSLPATMEPTVISPIHAVNIRNIFAANVGELTWCGQKSDIFTLHQVTVTPYPVVSGGDVTVHIAGS